MKIINNEPSIEPTIGKIISIKKAMLFLEENCIYLLPSIMEDNAQKIKETIKNTMKIADSTGNFLASYSCIPLMENFYIEDSYLKKIMKKEGYNAVLPLSFHSKAESKYLLLKIEENDIPQQVSEIIYSAERYTKHIAQEKIHQELLANPDSFKKWLEPVFSTTKFLKNFFASSVQTLFNQPVGMVPRMGLIKDVLGFKDDVVDFHKKSEMLKRITENVKKVRKNGDKKADAELTYLINSIPAEYIIEMLKNLTPSQLNKATPFLSSEVYAEKSRLRMEICEPDKMEGYKMPANKKNKNTGTYKLFLSKDRRLKAVNFSYKSSFIVYLIYLIDRCRKEDRIDPIDMLEKNWENEYYRLFNLVYPEHTDEAKSSYYSLTSEYKNNSNDKRKKRLGDCYADIKVCVGSALEELGEIIHPHIIENAGDHIATRPNNIHIPYKLLCQ